MKKLIAAFIAGGSAGAVALAIATGFLFGGSDTADAALATGAPELPPATTASSRPADAPANRGTIVPVNQPAEPAPAEPAPPPPPPPAPVDATSRFGVDPAQSTAKIVAYQTGLLGESTAVGTGAGVQGEIFLKQSGALGDSPSWIQVDMRNFKSGDAALQTFLKNDMQANQFPAGTFTIDRVDGIPADYANGAEFTFRMSGPLTMHGRTNYVTWSVKARQSGDFLTMAADTDFNLTDYGWTPPDYGIARAKNGVHLQVIILAGR